MAEQKSASMHIGQLNLRVPGASAEAGHRVADGITQGLAHQVLTDMRCRLGALSVRVQVPNDALETEMSSCIAEAIVKALRK